MTTIHCEIAETKLLNDNGRMVPGIVATCSKCDHQTQSFGTGEASITRCLVLLREDCPLGQTNFYTNGEQPMPIKFPPAPATANDELPSDGSHLAVCCLVVHMGSQPYEYQDEVGVRAQLQLGFELRDQYREGGRPFFPVRRTYSFSAHRNSHLRADLRSWLGRELGPAELRGFEFDRLIGKTAILGLIHNLGRNGRTYANISSILKPPVDTPESLEPETAPVVLDPFALNLELFGAQPDWLRSKLLEAEEYQLALGHTPALPKPAAETAKPLASRLQTRLGSPEPDDPADDDIPF